MCRDRKCTLLKHTHPAIFKSIDPKLNPKINLDELKRGSTIILNWICPINPCGHHIFPAPVYRRVRSKKDGCPYCNHRKVCPCDCLKNQRPDLMAFWDWVRNIEDGFNPKELSFGSQEMVNWICPEDCGHHRYKMRISHKTRPNGLKCPYCSNHKTCPCKSFPMIFPEIFLDFDLENNEGIDPYSLAPHSDKRVNWKGHECGHFWRTRINNRTNGRGNGCPICKESKLEKLCQSILDELEYEYKPEQTLPGCYDKQLLRFDFRIYDFSRPVVIDVDGSFHFDHVYFDGKKSHLEKVQRRDYKKFVHCFREKIHFLRISYSEQERMRRHIINFFRHVAETEKRYPDEAWIDFRGVEYEDVFQID